MRASLPPPLIRLLSSTKSKTSSKDSEVDFDHVDDVNNNDRADIILGVGGERSRSYSTIDFGRLTDRHHHVEPPSPLGYKYLFSKRNILRICVIINVVYDLFWMTDAFLSLGPWLHIQQPSNNTIPNDLSAKFFWMPRYDSINFDTNTGALCLTFISLSLHFFSFVLTGAILEENATLALKDEDLSHFDSSPLDLKPYKKTSYNTATKVQAVMFTYLLLQVVLIITEFVVLAVRTPGFESWHFITILRTIPCNIILFKVAELKRYRNDLVQELAARSS